MIVECSVCGKTNREVERVFAGRKGNICSECVDLCARLLDEIRNPTHPAIPEAAHG